MGFSLDARVGHLGFAVQQCSSKSYFEANLTLKIKLVLSHIPIKITYPQSKSLDKTCKT